jgi:uncharacterized membrane protein YraQ (UPF0718 family)
MLASTILMGVIALVLLVVAVKKGGGQHVTGLKAAAVMTAQVMPILIFAFVIAGLVQVLVPQEKLAEWVGDKAGARGIFLGTVAGGLCPGGPYVSLPIVAGLMRAGAGLGTLVAFLTAWSLWAVARLPMEVGIMGWRFTAIRFAVTFFFPPVAGLLAHWIFAPKG